MEGEETKCVLCQPAETSGDDDRLIVMRGENCYVIMNLYPYNSGHLMIVPNRHTADLVTLTDAESGEIMSLLKKSMEALRNVLHPDGYNIGSNVGRTAGAGIDQHVHFHIVPRWNGDTNFMPVLSDTKMISDDMRQTFHKLKQIM